jgi:hypothetical protein
MCLVIPVFVAVHWKLLPDFLMRPMLVAVIAASIAGNDGTERCPECSTPIKGSEVLKFKTGCRLLQTTIPEMAIPVDR